MYIIICIDLDASCYDFSLEYPVFDEARQHSDLANRIHESFEKARVNVGRWMNISDQEYLRQRNRVLGVT